MKAWLKQKKAYESFIICLFPVILYGIIGPLEIYVGNPYEFNFELRDFIYIFIFASLFIWVIASIILILLPKKISSIFKVVIFTFSLLSYLQNMFLNKKLINSNGDPMDWGGAEIRHLMTTNLIIWIVVAVLCFIIPLIYKKYAKIYFGISAFLSMVQIIAVISLLLRANSVVYTQKPLALNCEDQFELSANDNIIVFLLDGFSNTWFEYVLEENPDFAEGLKDFTYYNNADAHYLGTFPSMIHMLTGTDVDRNSSKEEYLNICWETPFCEYFWDTLHSKGYECDLYFREEPIYIGGSYENLIGKIDNVSERERTIRTDLLIRLMEKMTIYKYVPYICKPRFEVYSYTMKEVSAWNFDGFYGIDQDNSLCQNGVFGEKLLSDGIIIDTSINNKFSFNFLTGLHTPRQTLANGMFSETETSMEETSVGCIRILLEYINQLKELGIYDDATVIITADHGRDLSDPQVMFLIKSPNQINEQIMISSAPVSHDDLLPTILDILEVDYDEYGKSVYDWKEEDYRTRELWVPVTGLENGFGYDGYFIYSYDTDRTEINGLTEDDAVYVPMPTTILNFNNDFLIE